MKEEESTTSPPIPERQLSSELLSALTFSPEDIELSSDTWEQGDDITTQYLLNIYLMIRETWLARG